MQCVTFQKESYEETKGPLCHLSVRELDELRLKHTASQ